ncbi:REP-associated tyrosine transposase [Pseudomonas cichorii]|uniref:REP-associated tyrosine transposase n=2 Tax=Pseudomonadota TaxID=1224 RepID=UPI001C8A5EC7|nr:transposase [Pseudomonas cichorii]MBX8494270.1 transposase [Pseudomonas cichorii]MBX8574308.1 transposase [Pseudomonas cichorii]
MSERAQACRLRIGRYSQTGQIYLVTSVVQDRCPIFSDLSLGRLVVEEFKRAQIHRQATSLAWVVMPDHFHWLLELGDCSLSLLMKQTKACSSLSIQRATKREGRLWQAGFHDRAIRREECIQDVARYVVANPVRAGLVKRLGDYSLWDAIWV